MKLAFAPFTLALLFAASPAHAWDTTLDVVVSGAALQERTRGGEDTVSCRNNEVMAGVRSRPDPGLGGLDRIETFWCLTLPDRLVRGGLVIQSGSSCVGSTALVAVNQIAGNSFCATVSLRSPDNYPPPLVITRPPATSRSEVRCPDGYAFLNASTTTCGMVLPPSSHLPLAAGVPNITGRTDQRRTFRAADGSFTDTLTRGTVGICSNSFIQVKDRFGADITVARGERVAVALDQSIRQGLTFPVSWRCGNAWRATNCLVGASVMDVFATGPAVQFRCMARQPPPWVR